MVRRFSRVKRRHVEPRVREEIRRAIALVAGPRVHDADAVAAARLRAIDDTCATAATSAPRSSPSRSRTSIASLRNTSYFKLGRFSDERTMRGSRRPSASTMSRSARRVAVAVSACVGARTATSSRKSRTRRYDGRKSCPHCDAQCASSTASPATWPFRAHSARASRSLGARRDSGVVNRSAVEGPPSSAERRRSRSTARRRAGSVALVHDSASTSNSSHRRIWSRMRERSGETTTITPGTPASARAAAGSMYARLLPAPVGRTARQSRPSRAARMDSS